MSPSDFNLLQSLQVSVTIPAASTSYSLNQLTITDDNDNEPQESFTLVITEVSTGSISAARAIVNILDDDDPVPTTAPLTTGSGRSELPVFIIHLVVAFHCYNLSLL